MQEIKPTDTTKPVVIIFLYRGFDARLMIHNGVIARLAKSCRIILLAPAVLLDGIRAELGDAVEYEESQIHPSKYSGQSRLMLGRFSSMYQDLLTAVFLLTYGQKKDGTAHLTRDTCLKATKKSLLDVGLNSYIRSLGVTLLSNFACRFRWFRQFLQYTGYLFLNSDRHRELIRKTKPTLMVACSLGMADDAFFFREGRKNRVPTVAILQSWDKTSSIGYPLAASDYVFTWNHIMAEEVNVYHDIPASESYLTGVPQWDHYFKGGDLGSRNQFCEEFGLKVDRKVVYFSICSPAYHTGNMQSIAFLIDCLKKNRFVQPLQIIFRVHPFYTELWNEEDREKAQELIDYIDKIKDTEFAEFNFPAMVKKSDSALLEKDDSMVLHKLLHFCDLNVSVASSQMIEAAINDKPSISLFYGTWTTNYLGSVDFSDLKFEHLERIFKTGAITRVRSDDELLIAINQQLDNPSLLKKERAALVDQEVPVNRGAASNEIAAMLARIAFSENNNPCSNEVNRMSVFIEEKPVSQD